MEKERALELQGQTNADVESTRRLLYWMNKRADASREALSFDSMCATHPAGREAGFEEMPASFQTIASHPFMEGHLQLAFDGINDGISEYKLRHDKREPHPMVITAALDMAAAALSGKKADDGVEYSFDSLTLGHHESNSVVPSAVQVIISLAIAHSLPIVSMLPNAMGSNEIPIVYGSTSAGNTLAAMTKGDLIDGIKAGLPYFENRHRVLLEPTANAGEFAITFTTAYEVEQLANGLTVFRVNKTATPAPFLGGRVDIYLRGKKIASDVGRHHKTFKGISPLHNVFGERDGNIKMGANNYIVTKAAADLTTHTVTIQFDSAGDIPAATDVTVDLIYDYERKDDNGNRMLKEPSTDMNFNYESLMAFPSRARSAASIDAITQLANELGISWLAAAQTVMMRRHKTEETARLLRTAVEICLYSADPEKGNLVTYDFVTNGVSPTSIPEASSKINQYLDIARTRLSEKLNFGVSGYDIYVSKKGASFFGGMGATEYEATNTAYGDLVNIHQVGTLKGSNAAVYYVPDSMYVFNEKFSDVSARALIIPRPISPAQAPFVGFTAVPPMLLTAQPDAYEREVDVYSRGAADVNPVEKYADQFILLEMLNLPV